MFKRYFYTANGLIILLIIYGLALLPILAVRSNLENKSFAFALMIWGIVAGLFFIPALTIIIKKAWFFRGSGEPVVQELLRSMILGINDLNAPIQVRSHKKKLALTWRYQDRNWCEQMEKIKLKKLYELWLSFDNNTKTVTLTDKIRSVDWSLSPIKVKTGRMAFSKPLFKVETGEEWGIENYEDTAPNDYTFHPQEIKAPVMNTILKNGWNVRFSLF